MSRLLRLAFDDNKTALGRRLGYRDGSFVGQMLRGEKPITEITWARLCDLREVKPFLTGSTPVYSLPHLLREQDAAHAWAHATLAHAVSERRTMIEPRTLVWEDLVTEEIQGQFALAIVGDALAPQYLPGQAGIWEACAEGRPGQPVLLVDPSGQFYLRLFEPRPGGSWAGVSQRVGHSTLTAEQDGVRVLPRLRYLDLG